MKIHNFSDETIEKLNKTKYMVVGMIIGAIVGALTMGLLLDNRVGAFYKAWKFPLGVNSVDFETVVVIKK